MDAQLHEDILKRLDKQEIKKAVLDAASRSALSLEEVAAGLLAAFKLIDED